MNNETRADRAFRAFQIYQHFENEEETETVITELINDLFHFSDQMAVDMNRCYRTATDNYNTQKGYYSSEDRNP